MHSLPAQLNLLAICFGPLPDSICLLFIIIIAVVILIIFSSPQSLYQSVCLYSVCQPRLGLLILLTYQNLIYPRRWSDMLTGRLDTPG